MKQMARFSVLVMVIGLFVSQSVMALGSFPADPEPDIYIPKSCDRYLEQLCYNAVLPGLCSLSVYAGKQIQPPIVVKGFNECDAERNLKKHLCELNYDVESIPEKDIVCSAILSPASN